MLRRVMMAGASAPPASTYLDDLAVTPVTVWSLKRLISTAVNAIRVRRSSDNAQQDIALVGDVLDTAALSAFVGAGNGYVVTIYDQTGNGFNLTMATATQQPLIVSAGVYQEEIKWDGVNDRMRATAVTMGSAYLGFYARMKQANATGNKVLFDTTDGNTLTQAAKAYVSSGGAWQIQGRNAVAANCQLGFQPVNVTTKMSVQILYDRSLAKALEMKLWHNDIAQTVTSEFGSDMTGVFNSNDVVIGSHGDGTLPCDCAFESLALYNVDTSAYRTDIDAVI